MRPIRRIVVHHTASPDTWDAAAVRRCHVNERGYSDIGYHAVVLRTGEVQPGRPVEKEGAHAKGHNADSLGISLVGDFTQYHVPADQWDAAVAHVAGWLREYGLTVDDVFGHRELRGASTLCPGFDPEAFRSSLREATR